MANVGAVLEELRGNAAPQRMQLQIDEARRHTFDGLRKPTDEKGDTVFGLDDALSDDQLLPSILAKFGFESLNGQFGVASRLISSFADLETLVLQSDRSIKSLKLLVESRQAVVLLGDFRDQPRDGIVPAIHLVEIPYSLRIARVAKLSPDVDLPGDISGDEKIGKRIGKISAGVVRNEGALYVSADTKA
ncbi:MAG: hypothetical protein QM775_04360 [Pirellulales bacterium]